LLGFCVPVGPCVAAHLVRTADIADHCVALDTVCHAVNPRPVRRRAIPMHRARPATASALPT
jgi:hypothetical protein